MKTSILALTLIASAHFAAANDGAFGPFSDLHVSAPQARVQRFIAPQSGQSAALDLQIQNQMIGVGQIFVSCDFDGKADNCLLDTGSNVCLVSADDHFNKYPAKGQSCSEGASGTQVCSDIIAVGDLKVGAVDFGALPALRRTAAQSCGGGGPQLPSYLVGSVWHSLLGHTAAFDFSAKTLTVDPQGAPGTQQAMKLALGDNYMILPVSFGGDAVPMLYDTGAGLTVMDQAFVDANPSGFSFVADTQIQDSSCQKIPAKVYTVNSLSVGGSALSGTYAVGMDLSKVKKAFGGDLAGIIGFNAITAYNWSVDLKNRTFSAVPNGSGSSVAGLKGNAIPRELKMRLPDVLQGR